MQFITFEVPKKCWFWFSGLFVLVIVALVWKLLSSPTSVLAADLWYVAVTGSDFSDCKTKFTPCVTINGVLDKPGFTPGDTILVAGGDYTSTNTIVVTLTQDVILLGGWDASFSSQDERSTIFGDRGVQVESGVVALIDNFSIGGLDFGAVHNQGVLTLKQVDLGANYSSGLYNAGTLRIDDGEITHSLYTGIINDGSLIVMNTIIDENGRQGIVNSGIMTVTNSTISRHYLNWGGCNGIYNTGTMTITNSSIVDNGLVYDGPGGGICNYGEATLINSTVSNNQSNGDYGGGGGIYNGDNGYLALYNTTVSYNNAVRGDGIFNESLGAVTLQNSLLANNEDCYGIIQSLGYNLIENVTCTVNEGIGDLLNVKAQVFPAHVNGFIAKTDLPPVAPLLRTSSAIDAGDPEGCKDSNGMLLSTDQRGVFRLGRCDIGAYEYDPAFDPLKYLWFPMMYR